MGVIKPSVDFSIGSRLGTHDYKFLSHGLNAILSISKTYCIGDISMAPILKPSFLAPMWVMSDVQHRVKPGPTFRVIIWFVTWAAPEWSGLGPWLREPLSLRVCLVHVIDPQYLCKPFYYPTWQIIVPLKIGGSSTRGMSQIWLEVGQEWRKKIEFCFVLATFRKVLSKYGDLRVVFPPNMATLRYFFQKKNALCTHLHWNVTQKTNSLLGTLIWRI